MTRLVLRNRIPRNLLGALALASCAETGQREVAIPLYVAGADASSVEASGGVSVTLDRADLAFGPLYLCAGTSAGELCDTARLEWLDSVVVDTLSRRAESRGDLGGVTGPVRSFMYDLGLSSLLTRDEPLELPAARDLGGVSLRLEGTAEAGGQSLPFVASVAIRQTDETEQGVPVVRKSQTDVFEHEVTGDEPGLLIRFDPRPWVRDIDFFAFVEDEGCAPGRDVVCRGSIEQICSSDGEVTMSRDCAEDGSVCVAGEGCGDRIVVEAETPAYRAIKNAVVAGPRPSFSWDASP